MSFQAQTVAADLAFAAYHEQMRRLEHLIPPPLVALLLAVAMGWVSGWASAWPWQDGLRLMLVGSLAAVGLVFDLSGLRAFLRQRTTINPMRPERTSALVVNGVYRFTRNPMYVGLCFLLLAWAMHLWTLWAMAGPALFVAWITRFQILPEERMLSQKFGEEYRAYQQRVRRWL